MVVYGINAGRYDIPYMGPREFHVSKTQSFSFKKSQEPHPSAMTGARIVRGTKNWSKNINFYDATKNKHPCFLGGGSDDVC